MHKTDEGFILYANITEYQGVVRSFKPENPLTPGICAVPFYSQEYEVRKKDAAGNWISEKEQPSKFEIAICKNFAESENQFIGEGKALSGHITHLPDAMCMNLDDAAIPPLSEQNALLTPLAATGKIPEFKPPYSGGQRKSGSWGKSVSSEDKVTFLIKQLTEDIKHVDWKSGKNLAELTDQMIVEHADNENFIQIYFDMLMACVR